MHKIKIFPASFLLSIVAGSVMRCGLCGLAAALCDGLSLSNGCLCAKHDDSIRSLAHRKAGPSMGMSGCLSWHLMARLTLSSSTQAPDERGA
jgi:hypothetical protein